MKTTIEVNGKKILVSEIIERGWNRLAIGDSVCFMDVHNTGFLPILDSENQDFFATENAAREKFDDLK